MGSSVQRNKNLPALATPKPLYERVELQLISLVLARSLTDTSALPTEPKLMELFGVSRGTLRRSIEELVRTGLLKAEQGRGTFVVQEERVRRVVWNRLADVAHADSRFDMDLRHFVPDFAGGPEASARVLRSPQWQGAQTIFCAPDNSIERLRLQALRDGQRILVPTHGLHRGFVLLDGATINPADAQHASTLDGMEKYGIRLGPGDLRSAGTIELVVTGATAVTTDGRHIGGGQRYLALEWMMMKQLGVVHENVPVLAVVHDCQVVEEMIEAEPDCLLSSIFTNTRHIEIAAPVGNLRSIR